jgi:uncharacterized protein
VIEGRGLASLAPASAFVDSSAFFALAHAPDDNHRLATELLAGLVRGRTRLITTNFVIAEAHALLVNRTRRQDLGAQFLERLYGSPSMERVRVADADEQQAVALVIRYRDKLFSLTDATSFVVMERPGIRHAFTFDADFAQYGVTVLTAEHL